MKTSIFKYLSFALVALCFNCSLASTFQATPGFTLSKTTAEVSENGATDQVTVVLNVQPSDNVFIIASSDNGFEVEVNPISLTFTPDNWSTPQAITISSVDDNEIDGTTVTKVDISILVNSAPEYRGLAIQSIDVTSRDNEDPLSARDLPNPTIYPNPSNGTLNLKNLQPDSKIEISNMSGQRVSMYQNGNRPQIRIDKLKLGLYFLKISSKEKVKTYKLVVR